jgi:putative membrane protein
MRPTYQRFNGKVRSNLIAFAGFALLTVHYAMAQGATGGRPMAGPTTTLGSSASGHSDDKELNDPGVMADKVFVKNALQGSVAEIQLGQLALQKSSNDDVKQFAQKMIDDHTKLDDQMKQVAQQMKVKVPDSPSSKDKSAIAKLQALNGDEFDKAYIKDMMKNYQQDAKDFKQEAQNTDNSFLKQVVSQDAQVISEHLQKIQEIAQKDNVSK